MGRIAYHGQGPRNSESREHRCLTYWGRDKMVDTLETILQNSFSWNEIALFWFKYHWTSRIQLYQHGLAPVRRQATVQTNDDLNYWRIYESLDRNELTFSSTGCFFFEPVHYLGYIPTPLGDQFGHFVLSLLDRNTCIGPLIYNPCFNVHVDQNWTHGTELKAIAYNMDLTRLGIFSATCIILLLLGEYTVWYTKAVNIICVYFLISMRIFWLQSSIGIGTSRFAWAMVCLFLWGLYNRGSVPL